MTQFVTVLQCNSALTAKVNHKNSLRKCQMDGAPTSELEVG